MKARFIALLAVFCFWLPASAYSAEEIKGKYSDAEIMEILRADGFSAVTKLDEGAIQVNVNGRTHILFNNDDGDLQGYFVTSGVTLSYEDMNEWNRTKRLSRAYLDADNDPVLEADLLSNGGLTKKNVGEFFRIFVNVSVPGYIEFLLENDQS
ncbi:YbjN domain-containing protein [Marinobacter persicus]|uniref:Sensory transduction regulator n=1 Tax=Marinobacter persicus TaxID=930118 RepID=A0A2S6G2I1_9GAMM|nr:YbjN domain-containing protein [Marinobacter persicus]PPK50026.1 putative sensory transduction regulator [Marinobacter persicus]PPK52072.1 putative sensory transduction regulator [Marinobacter persicus]PPK56603.1 putative sensory transduction regulator [Marinobacter persicus]